MPLSPGTRLGPYEVTAQIGKGGMGEVYRARDTSLDRDVAIKVLPAEFASDPERLARFEREAKVLASLNHPNIAAIYGLEKSGDSKALVLELVPGPTLQDRIAQGAIPLDEALPIARQIAEALEAAHEQGIIHRDLKPSNIKVTPDGVVKVLDFGLAKALEPERTEEEVVNSPTMSMTAAATKMGMIMGTAAYMSPEQAKGKSVDKRTDIWAFGVVLFEMLTGRQAFSGEDISDTLVSVFREDPDWSALPDGTALRIHQTLRICLQKDARQRVRDISAIRLAMEGAFESAGSVTPDDVGPAPELALWQRPVPLLMAAMLLVGLSGFTVWSLFRPAPSAPPPATRFVVSPHPDGPLRTAGLLPQLTISPDGTRIVYGSGTASTRRLYMRETDQLDAARLRGSEGGDFPFFSPDGEWVAFRVGDTTLKKVSAFGGPAVTICEGCTAAGASWGLGDQIVFGTPSGGLKRVPAVGGEPEVLTTVEPGPDVVGHYWPEVLPNGRAVLFTVWSGSAEASQIAAVSLDTGEVTYLVEGGSQPRYSPTGHIVYGVGGTLRAVAFDAERLAVTGNPFPVMENVNTKENGGAANFSLSGNGSLVYVTGRSGAERRTLVWVDRAGREEPLPLAPAAFAWPRLSPDGTRLAVHIREPEGTDVWMSEVARGTLSKLTTDPADDSYPLWTPDGQSVVFTSRRDGLGVYRTAADGRGAVERLLTVEDATDLNPYGWAADGQALLFSYAMPAGVWNFGLWSSRGDTAWAPLLDTERMEAQPTISPDGAWVAYASNETGRTEVYVERFPDLGDRRQISIGGGAYPLWSPDGRELFYWGLNRAVMAVPIETEPVFTPGTPEALFDNVYTAPNGREYDITPDGQQFLMLKEGDGVDDAAFQSQIVLVQHWAEELKARVPTGQ